MRAKNALQVITAASFALIVGCATNHTPMNSEVADSEVSAGSTPISSMAVVMMTEDQEQRIEWEDSFAATMNSAGLSTKTTHQLLPELAAGKNIEDVRALYEQTGAESGLTVELIAAQSQKALKATKASGAGFWAALILDQPEIADGLAIANLASYQKARQYQMRLTLWDAESQKQLWTMDTQSFTTFGVASKDARVMAETGNKELRAKGLVL